VKVVPAAALRRDLPVSKYQIDLKLLRQSNHPGLVRVFDIGEHLGRLYIAMELLDGASLRELLRLPGGLPLDACNTLLWEMCDALEALHARHVIHRDIHPGNIMQTASGAWKLMDFGIGRDKRKSAYASPEVALGQEARFASDIYSIAAIYCELLTGRHPENKGRAVPVERHIAGAPERLTAVLESCLQRDPAKRFQSAQSLKQAIREAFAGHSGSGARSLAALRSESGLPAQELLPVFQNIVRTLIESHASGPAHAELSPDNILVNGSTVEFHAGAQRPSASGGQPTLLIADAKYTAPELILAQRAPDPAAHERGDVYVLGFLFYELLAGTAEMQRQFGDHVRTGLAWMRWHADPVSKLRPLADVARACPRGVAELVERMVEKEPSRRVQTLGEVDEALGKLGFILARTQPAAVGRPAMRKRRHKEALALTAISAVTVLAVIAAAARYGPRIRELFTQPSARIGLPAAKASAVGASLPSTIETATGAMVLVAQSSAAGAAPFYIDRLEVTNRNYREYCARAGRRMPDAPSWDPEYFGKDDLPVVGLDRDSAASYCRAAEKRLPTEREWEDAAGAAERPGVRWGNWTLPGLANLRLDGAERPAPVGSFLADVSPFGVFDAAGNVQEWVAGDADGGKGVVKGGAFAIRPEQLSPVWRHTLSLNAGAADLSSVGCRCAADVQPALSLQDRGHVAAARGPGAWIRRLADGIR
jgi:serine/threonine protein kinase